LVDFSRLVKILISEPLANDAIERKQLFELSTPVWQTPANALKTQLWTALIAMLVVKCLQLRSTSLASVVVPAYFVPLKSF